MQNKNLFHLALAVAILASSFTLTATACPNDMQKRPQQQCNEKLKPPSHHNRPQLTPEQRAKMQKEHAKRKAQFDARLKLTDTQKKIIEQNRIDSQKKIKPLFDKIKADQKKINDIQESNRALSEKDKLIAPIKIEIKTIRKEIHQIREDNRKAFESILTAKQQKELAKMNAERKKHMDAKKKKGCPPPPKKIMD